MAGEGSGARRVFTSPEAAPSADRARQLERWWDEYRMSISGLDMTIDSEPIAPAKIEYLTAGSVGLGRGCGPIARFERRPEHIGRDGKDRFNLVVNRSRNPSSASNRRRTLTVPPGAAALFDYGESHKHSYTGGYGCLAFMLPRDLLLQSVPRAADMTGTVVAANDGALRLAVFYADGLLDSPAVSDVSALTLAGRHLVDLVALALGTDRDNAEAARQRGLRAVRLQAVLRLIRQEYTDPSISPGTVAARIGISIRYLHELLHETGVSFAERVQELRLARAMALLSGIEGAPRKVGEAAYEAGFNDLSHFNRLFRRRYGTTPTAARGRGAPHA